MAYTNSPLVSYTRLSPNFTGTRKSEIKVITIHCVVGQVTIERLGEIFANPSRQASSNYGVDKNGRIGLFVEERHRSWCSGGKDGNGNPIRVNGISGADNDHQAITIEVASDTVEPYGVTPAAYEALILLVADICKRNPSIGTLRWMADKSLVGKPELQNMTVHRWFANKSCPGSYLYDRMGDIATRVNVILKAGQGSQTTDPDTIQVPVTYEDVKVGDILNFTGIYNYSSSGSTKAVPTSKSLCKVTSKTSKTAKHPIHVRAVDKSGKYVSGVYGWVDLADLTRTVAKPVEPAQPIEPAGPSLPANCKCNSCENVATCEVITAYQKSK